MTDDADSPPRRGRVTRLPAAPDQQGANREELSLWMKEQFAKIQEENERRIENLRNAGEHPSPVFANMIKRMAMVISPHHIAKLVGLNYNLMMQHYSDEIERGTAEVNALIATNMIKIATDPENPAAGKVGMAILDRRGGDIWAPATKKIEVEDVTKRPPVIDSSRLTAEQRVQLREMIESTMGNPTGDVVDDQ